VKTHQNTLYVTTQGSYLARQGLAVLVRVKGETRLHVPIHNLSGIVCFGRVGCSPPLMALCGEAKVALSFMSTNGRFLARVEGPISGNVLLRREQYRRADEEAVSSRVARLLVAGKLANCRTLLLRAARDRAEGPAAERLRAAAQKISEGLHTLESQSNLDSVRGTEGEAAAAYFAVFDDQIVAQKDGFRFTARSRRPPLDPVNAILSFLYTLLAHDVRAALETVGLDPAVGFLHRDRPARPGLALDLMEELRPGLADRVALSVINRKQVTAHQFRRGETGGVVMSDEARKTVLTTWQERKNEEVMHPLLGERMTTGLVPFIQARLFARYLRGDLAEYPPFVWK
jgi:CRISP-associated protein Cas1